MFPIFRGFNLVAGMTKSRALFITSPSFGGIPYEFWMDWRNENNDLQIEEIIIRFKLVSWNSICLFQYRFQIGLTSPTPILASLLEIIPPFSNAIMVGTAFIEYLSHNGLLSSSILDS